MPGRRFFIPSELIQNGIASLPPDQAHHLRDVLRLKSGDVVDVIDGTGMAYSGRVEIRGADVYVAGLRAFSQDLSASTRITLAPALIKSDRFEWILQKSTELGVQEIVPLRTRHCEIRIPETRMEARLERWRRITREAAKQCLRTSIPQVHPALPFREFLHTCESQLTDRILFHEKAEAPWKGILNSCDRTVLCTGPEGGWHESEVADAKNAGFRILNLGPLRLRAETAALVAVTLAQFHPRAAKADVQG